MGPAAEGMGPRRGVADGALDVRPAHLSRQLPRRTHPDRRGAARMGSPRAGAVPTRRGLASPGRRRSGRDSRLGSGGCRTRRPRVAVGSGLVAARPLGRHRGRRPGTRPRALRVRHALLPVPVVAALLATQVIVVVLCQARGAFFGMLAGLSVTALALLARRRAWKALASVAAVLVAVALFVAAVERAYLAPGSPPREAAAQPAERSRRTFGTERPAGSASRSGRGRSTGGVASLRARR